MVEWIVISALVICSFCLAYLLYLNFPLIFKKDKSNIICIPYQFVKPIKDSNGDVWCYLIDLKGFDQMIMDGAKAITYDKINNKWARPNHENH